MIKKLIFTVLSVFSISLAFAVVNINTASEQELRSLNGIGPSKAAAIIQHRTEKGPFKTVDDIKQVKGIGNGIFNKIKDEISVDGKASQPVPAPAAEAVKPATKK